MADYTLKGDFKDHLSEYISNARYRTFVKQHHDDWHEHFAQILTQQFKTGIVRSALVYDGHQVPHSLDDKPALVYPERQTDHERIQVAVCCKYGHLKTVELKSELLGQILIRKVNHNRIARFNQQREPKIYYVVFDVGDENTIKMRRADRSLKEIYTISDDQSRGFQIRYNKKGERQSAAYYIHPTESLSVPTVLGWQDFYMCLYAKYILFTAIRRLHQPLPDPVLEIYTAESTTTYWSDQQNDTIFTDQRHNIKISNPDGPAIKTVSKDGSREIYEWWINNIRTRDDGPAYEEWAIIGGERFKTKEIWYKNGMMHRDDYPAIQGWQWHDGRMVKILEKWYKDNKLHRDGRPAHEAWEWHDGKLLKSRECWYLDGDKHRENQPAEQTWRWYKDSMVKTVERWYDHGKLHREGSSSTSGPAEQLWGNPTSCARYSYEPLDPNIEIALLREAWYNYDVICRDDDYAEMLRYKDRTTLTWFKRVEETENHDTKTYIIDKSMIHRTDGPARIELNKDRTVREEWMQNGKHHRPSKDGPAIMTYNECGQLVSASWIEAGVVLYDERYTYKDLKNPTIRCVRTYPKSDQRIVTIFKDSKHSKSIIRQTYYKGRQIYNLDGPADIYYHNGVATKKIWNPVRADHPHTICYLPNGKISRAIWD